MSINNELIRIIVGLVTRIAVFNKTYPNARVGDVIFLKKDKSGTHQTCMVQRLSVSSNYHSWVMTNRDREPWNKVVARLTNLNNNVSKEWIENELQGLIGRYRNKNWQLSGIQRDSTSLIDRITAEKGGKITVFLPVWGLILGLETFKIGDVQFHRRNAYKEIDDRLKKLEDSRQTERPLMVETIAITEATGDIRMAVKKARDKVNQALNIFRAFKYPIVENRLAGYKQIDTWGDFLVSPKYYLARPEEPGSTTGSMLSEGLDYSGVLDVVIDEQLLNLLPNTGFYKLSEFLVSRPSEFQKGLLRGAVWLGEATKPDRLESKFLKVAFAIDAMLGQESSDIPDKGKRARIAERAAFLLSSKLKCRRQVYEEIKKFVGKRDALAHGADENISDWETERFGTYTRSVLTTLLLREPPFMSHNDLAKWVHRQSLKG